MKISALVTALKGSTPWWFSGLLAIVGLTFTYRTSFSSYELIGSMSDLEVFRDPARSPPLTFFQTTVEFANVGATAGKVKDVALVFGEPNDAISCQAVGALDREKISRAMETGVPFTLQPFVSPVLAGKQKVDIQVAFVCRSDDLAEVFERLASTEKVSIFVSSGSGGRVDLIASKRQGSGPNLEARLSAGGRSAILVDQDQVADLDQLRTKSRKVAAR